MNVILLVIPLVTFAIIALVYIPYDIWKNQKDKIKELDDAIKRTTKISEEVRADIARLRDSKALKIPSTLENITKQIQEIAKAQIKKGIDTNKMREALIDLLEIYEIDTSDIRTISQDNSPTVNEKKLRKEIHRLIRGTEKALAVKSVGMKKLITFLLDMEGVLKRRNISIEQYSQHNRNYNNLVAQLDKQRERATEKLATEIEDVILFVNGLGNYMLVSLYTGTDYSVLEKYHTLRIKKYTTALFALHRPFAMYIKRLIGRVSKYADEYVVGIDEV